VYAWTKSFFTIPSEIFYRQANIIAATPTATRHPLVRRTIPDASELLTTAVELAEADVAWLLPEVAGVDNTASSVAVARLALALALTLWM
jgi:hypothetical protein